MHIQKYFCVLVCYIFCYQYLVDSVKFKKKKEKVREYKIM